MTAGTGQIATANDNEAASAKAIAAAIEHASIVGYYAALADLNDIGDGTATAMLFDDAAVTRHPFLRAELQSSEMRAIIAATRNTLNETRRLIAVAATVTGVDPLNVSILRPRKL